MGRETKLNNQIHLIISCNIKFAQKRKEREKIKYIHMSGFVFGMFNDFVHLNNHDNDDHDANGSSRKPTEVV